MSQLTQEIHDMEQARRRTSAQNQALIDIIQGTIKVHPAWASPRVNWSYTDVPPEGGSVTLTAPDGQAWEIDRAGLAMDLSGS